MFRPQHRQHFPLDPGPGGRGTRVKIMQETTTFYAEANRNISSERSGAKTQQKTSANVRRVRQSSCRKPYTQMKPNYNNRDDQHDRRASFSGTDTISGVGFILTQRTNSEPTDLDAGASFSRVCGTRKTHVSNHVTNVNAFISPSSLLLLLLSVSYLDLLLGEDKLDVCRAGHVGCKKKAKKPRGFVGGNYGQVGR